MLRLELYTLYISRDYSTRDFKKDLKFVMEQTGILGKPFLLFIEDHHIVKSEFLELLNSLIASGEVPGLFTPEEVEQLFSSSGIGDEIRRENYGKSLYECFLMRLKFNLRIVLSLDHSHPKFSQNCASNPSLYNKCSIIWFDTWSKESMAEIIN